MKIVLLGYGKMGQLIETFALKRGHEVVLIVDADNRESNTSADLKMLMSLLILAHQTPL